MNNYRLYSFVANHYISPLQCGLQTAHVVGDLSVRYKHNTEQHKAYEDWAAKDKTVIILGAGNHKGIVDCYQELQRVAEPLGLAFTIFCEDEQSMNRMATACGVIVPEKYYNTVFDKSDSTMDISPETHPGYFFYEHIDANFVATRYRLTHPEGQFIHHIKKYRLA